MSEIYVKDWISYEEAEANKYEESCGGLGGFFNFNKSGMRWKDYIEICKEEARPRMEALRKEIVNKNIRITGEDHQYSETGVPLFNDNTVGSFSYRAWGDLMAAIWSEEENKDYNYMDFYM